MNTQGANTPTLDSGERKPKLIIPKLNLSKAVPDETYQSSPQRWMQLVLTALPQSICGMTLLGYYPVEEMVEIDLRATLRYANLPTLLFIFSSALMILPSIKAFNELMISQQVLIAVCFQMLSVFAKIFRVVPNIHQCYIESILIGFSFPFLLGAVQNSVFRWFPRKERMWAFAIASMPLAVAAGLKFAFVTKPSHAVGQVEFNISTVEIVESLFICTQGMLAVLYIQDQPAVFPSYMATQNRESIETQWSSMSHQVWGVILTFTMAEASILSGEFKHYRNIPFAFGVLIGVATSFKLSIYIETTQTFLKTSQSIVIGILVLKFIGLIFGAVPGFFMGAVVSLAAVGLGVLTFLLVPLTLTFITELTHPVVTHIPQLLIFWITAFTAVIISKRSIWFENIPLAVSAVIVMLTRESDGWESLRQELSSPALKKKLLDHHDDA